MCGQGQEKDSSDSDYRAMRQTKGLRIFDVELLSIDVSRSAMPHFPEDISQVPERLFHAAAKENHQERQYTPQKRGDQEDPKPVPRPYQRADGGHEFYVARSHRPQSV